MTDYRTTIHADGTVTYWNVFEQGWVLHVPASWISDEVLATLSANDRKRIERAVLRDVMEAAQ